MRAATLTYNGVTTRTEHRVGNVYGRLTITARQGRYAWAVCACGSREKRYHVGNLASGVTQSCGCLHSENLRQKNIVHGMRRAPEYNVWVSMRNRCNLASSPNYHNYGGRGITVCPEWDGSFAQFISDMGRRPYAEATIERRDNDGPYCKENCYWASRKEQSRNRRVTINVTWRGETKALADWCEELGLRYFTARERLIKGFSLDRVFATSDLRAGRVMPKKKQRSEVSA